MPLVLTLAPPLEGAFTFSGDLVALGRADGNDVVLRDPRISGIHGRLVLQAGRWVYQDLNSRNGSMVEHAGQRLDVAPGADSGVPVAAGDCLCLGDRQTPVKIEVTFAERAAGKAAIPATVVGRWAMAQANEPRAWSATGQLETVLAFLDELASADDLAATLGRTADVIFRALPKIHRLSISAPEGEAGYRRIFSRGRLGAEENAREAPKAIISEALARNEAVLYATAGELPASRSVALSGAQGAICVPLASRTGRAPVLHLETLAPPGPDENDLRLAAVLGAHLAVVLDRLKALEQLRAARDKLAQENRYLKDCDQRRQAQEISGHAPEIEKLRGQIRQVAPTGTTVLLQGETGTGKEIVARMIHAQSNRADHLFIAVNCGAIPENLLESELFGHVRGAFTGAVQNRQGMFTLADDGTLFLDEIGDMPLNLQVKLLRVLQDGEFWPVGATQPRRANVRVLAATNRDLLEETKAGRFREDLYYRLCVVALRVPPLRERRADVPLIAREILEQIRERRPQAPREITPEAMLKLSSYGFPGNIRELLNEIERASLFAEPGGLIQLADLSPQIAGEPTGREAPGAGPRKTLKEIMHAYERQVLALALQEQKGNKTATAKALGISRQALLAKMTQLGLR